MLSIFSCPYWPFVYLFFVINVCLDPLLILIWLFVFLLLSHKSSVNILDISQSRSAVWLCHTMDCSLPCSSLRGILQARILEWIAVSFSRGSSQPRDQTQVSCVARWILYHLSHQGSSRILEWEAYPFSRGSSWPRNWTGVSCIAGGSLPTEPPGKPKFGY